MTYQSDLVSRIVRAFGGISPMARALGHDYPSTVQGWKARGVIPRWRINEIRHSSLYVLNGELRDLVDELAAGLGRREPGSRAVPSCFLTKNITKNVIFEDEMETVNSAVIADAEKEPVPQGVVISPLLDADVASVQGLHTPSIENYDAVREDY